MIDSRYMTFLTLCEIKNYTKAAKHLYITQPAVTQHIQYLEERYQCKLFTYANKKLELTFQGEQLRDFLIRIVADTTHFERNIENQDYLGDSILFGATLSIGEYIMPEILTKLITQSPGLNIHMEVNNTQVLLDKLKNGEIDFAIVEGMFDKSNYQSMLFSLENFIPICAVHSLLQNQTVDFADILKSTLVIREQGSGTREILENILKQYNYALDSFKNVIEIGNMTVIKELVASNVGISFMYEVVANKEIEGGKLSKIEISGFDVTREFNFVFLKNSYFATKYMEYFKLMKKAYSSRQ